MKEIFKGSSSTNFHCLKLNLFSINFSYQKSFKLRFSTLIVFSKMGVGVNHFYESGSFYRRVVSRSILKRRPTSSQFRRHKSFKRLENKTENRLEIGAGWKFSPTLQRLLAPGAAGSPSGSQTGILKQFYHNYGCY